MNYITKEGDSNILTFKYKGQSLSLSYKYIWGPLAQKLLTFVPPTIAPNTITMVGFLFNIFATIILCLQLPYSSDAPRWSIFLFGFSVFVYQTLDNMDGKQARKIKNSTPLGMMMDHGCDSLTVLTLTAGFARVACLDSQKLVIWALLVVVTSFYFTAWCQYYSNGHLILGEFNAVDDGLPGIWIFSLVTALVGQQFWRIPITLFGHTILVNQIGLSIIIFSSLSTIYFTIVLAGQQFTKDTKKATSDLIHVALMVGTISLIMFFSDIAQTHVAALALGLTFTMARTISYTLLCTVTKMEFKQFQPSLIVFTLVYSIYVVFLQGRVNAGLVAYGVAAFAIIQYFVFVITVMNHIADLLQITIFKVFKPKDQ